MYARHLQRCGRDGARRTFHSVLPDEGVLFATGGRRTRCTRATCSAVGRRLSEGKAAFERLSRLHQNLVVETIDPDLETAWALAASKYSFDLLSLAAAFRSEHSKNNYEFLFAAAG